MDKYISDLFVDVELGAWKDLMVMQVQHNLMAKKVLIEIAKNDASLGYKDNVTVDGVTKEKIRLSIYTETTRGSKKNGDEKVVRKVNPSIKVIDDAVSFLDGATLVYHQSVLKEKRWKLTSRGIEVVMEMMNQNEIDMEELR